MNQARPMVLDVVEERPWWVTCDIPTFRAQVATLDRHSLMALGAELNARLAKLSAIVEDVEKDSADRRSARYAVGWYAEKRAILKPLLSAAPPEPTRPEIGKAERERQRLARHQERVETWRRHIAAARAALDAGDLPGALSRLLDTLEAKNEG